MTSFSKLIRSIYLMIGGYGGFILFSTLSMVFYRGGSEYAPHILTYNFFSNFLSDLGYIHTYSGESNTISMILFAIAMGIIGITTIPFMFMFYFQFPLNPSERFVAFFGGIIGIISALAYIGVGLTPMDQVEFLHDFMTSVAFGGNMFAAFLFAIIYLRSSIIPRKFGVLLLLAVVVIVIYSILQISVNGIETSFVHTLTATAQKVVVYLQLAFLFRVNIGVAYVFRKYISKKDSLKENIR